jgi:hypothetical protein
LYIQVGQDAAPHKSLSYFFFGLILNGTVYESLGPHMDINFSSFLSHRIPTAPIKGSKRQDFDLMAIK